MVSADAGGGTERFVVLDGLRGLAAFAVIVDHVHSSFLGELLPGRYLAVDFFFVLSGFVLAHVYGRRLAGGMTPLQFLRARVIRLYPLYILAAAIGAVLALLYAVKGWSGAAPQQVASALLFAVFLIPCPPPFSIWANAPYPLNGPSWSLFFELFVNAVYALVARWITPRLCLVLMGVGAALLVPTAFGFGRLDGGFAWSNFIAGFPRVTFGFFAGVWLYHLHLKRTLPALPPWAAYLALFAILAAPAQGLWRAGFDLAAALFLFPAVVALSANSQAKGAGLRASAFMGLVSYGVYVLHVPIWGWLQLVLDALGLAPPGLANVALTALLAGAGAWALHWTYDAPLRRWLSRRPARPAAATE